MNVNGTVKIFKLEPQNNGKVVKGQLFYSTNVNVTSGKLRNRSYQSKDGQYRTWLEITVFDFELPEVKPHNQNGFGFTGKKF